MEQAYLNLVREVIEHGDYRIDRTKAGTYSLFAKQLVFNLDGKILSNKKSLKELLWIMKGQTNSNILDENNVKIWNNNGF